jgi:general stress protein 26
MRIDQDTPLTEDMRRVVNEQKLAFVATVCPDGSPNLSPKGTIVVWDDTHLVFADIRSPATVSNLRQNPAVEINVVDPFARKGYRFKGAAELVIDGELFDKILRFYRNRWVDTARSKPEPSIRTFVLVEVQRALPLISPAYDDDSDESGIRATWVAYFKVLNENEKTKPRTQPKA